MANREQRWYRIIDGTLYIYEQPYPKYSVSCSIVSTKDLRYYKQRFILEKTWDN